MARRTGVGDTLPAGRLPGPGRRTPVSTYRLQLTPEFTFADAAALLPYLDSLGVTDLYLSPILQAVPGSAHGYDVVDHSRVRDELGGRAGLEALAEAAHARGMGMIVDIVPNHMAAPTPAWHNPVWWSFLRDGPASPYAHWFDTDPGAPTLVPVLGAPLDEVLAADELRLTHETVPGEEERGRQPVLRYHEHVLPVRAGTEDLDLPDLVAAQHHRPAWWRTGDEELSYRRFFDVTSLVGLRVEDERVFAATHVLLLDLLHSGVVDGFRVDHPDGLADPRGYLRRLHEASGGAWVVAEKILEGAEELPEDWPVAGTTGYDAAWRLHGLQVDRSGAGPLRELARELGAPEESLPALAESARRQLLSTSLRTELDRLGRAVHAALATDTDLRDHTPAAVHQALGELLVAFPRYRAYVVPGEDPPEEAVELLGACAQVARRRLPAHRRATLDMVVEAVLGQLLPSPALAEAVVRFQQVCGALTAKAVEDTTFYRWTDLVSLCEVGGAPERFGAEPAELLAWARRTTERHPATMTAGSTHDTKRGEDVRARLAVLSGHAEEWAIMVRRLRESTQDVRPGGLDGASENLLWQTLVGTWREEGPLAADRLCEYLRKAVREQKSWTSWTEPDERGEEDLLRYAEALLAHPAVRDELGWWAESHREDVRRAVLATKLLQLTLPGVADVYRGTEVVETALVDPDNRRPVDFGALARALAAVDARARPEGLGALDAEKLRLTAAALRLRRRHAAAFVGPDASFRPLPVDDGHVVAFARGDGRGPRALTVATRLAAPHPDAVVLLPPGRWRGLLGAEGTHDGGARGVGELLGAGPVALLERVEG